MYIMAWSDADIITLINLYEGNKGYEAVSVNDISRSSFEKAPC